MTGIYFDIDDTLYSRRALLLRAAGDTLQGMAEHPVGLSTGCSVGDAGSEAENLFIKVFYRYGDENYPLVVSGEITPWESNVWRFVMTARHLGVNATDADGEAFANRYTYLQEHMEMSDQLHMMMRALSACPGIRLGVITNGASEFQWKKYWTLGLDSYIDEKYVLVSGDVGSSKPEEGIFRASEARMGLAPEDLWLVGDSVKHDIRGAKACGWHTLWLRRNKDSLDGARTDLQAADESEMCRMLLGFPELI